MGQIQFEQKLKAEGFSEIAVSEIAANEHRDEHSHDFQAALYVLDGQITVTCEGEQTTCAAGDTFTLAAGRVHTEDIGPSGVRFVVGRKY